MDAEAGPVSRMLTFEDVIHPFFSSVFLFPLSSLPSGGRNSGARQPPPLPTEAVVTKLCWLLFPIVVSLAVIPVLPWLQFVMSHSIIVCLGKPVETRKAKLLR